MKPIRILLADDHTVVRDGLRALLDREPDMTVVAEAADGRECVRLAEAEIPDIVVMDLAMPVMDGIQATRRMLAQNPGTAVLILSMNAQESCIRKAFHVGVRGYVVKGAANLDLAAAIKDIATGKQVLSCGTAGS